MGYNEKGGFDVEQNILSGLTETYFPCAGFCQK
jgi:hypothetical protein